MYYGNDCHELLTDPACNVCEDGFELAGIGQSGVVRDDYYATLAANPTNPAVWLTGIQTGKIKIVPGIRGDFDGGAAVYGPGYGRRIQTLLSMNFKGKLYDPNYLQNGAFYDELLLTSNWHIAINSATQTHLSTYSATFAVGNPIVDDITKNIEWVTEFQFSQKGLFLPFTTPAGIFDCSWVD